MADLELRPSSGSGWVVLACGAIAILIGLVQRNAALISFGAVLAASMVGLYWYLKRSTIGIHVDRRLAESAYEGSEVDVEIEVRNDSLLPVFFPYVEEVFHPEVHSQRRLLFPGAMLPGETISLPYVGQCVAPRGIYGVGPAALMISDPFGFFRRATTFTSSTGIKVYPPLTDESVREQVGRFLAAYDDEEGRRGLGRSDEFYKVREYQSGDSHRMIHWRLTAHLGFPVVREHAQASGGGMSIFLDAHRDALVGTGRNSSFECAIRLAVGLTQKALSRGRGAQLFTSGAKGRDVLQCVTNAAEFRRLLDALLYAQPDPHRRSFVGLLERSVPRVQRESTVVVTVSPYLYESEELFERLFWWSRRRHRIVLIIFGEFADARGRTHEANLAAAQAYARRSMGCGFETILFSCGARSRALPRSALNS
ncbi:MAG: DUF58 domain-containing protein [Planctomycetes bacterium]|nr:DUF58 domain-containing protein [Planctomycetota bacterium]